MALGNVSDSEFQSKVIDASKPVLVDFWAAWCAPCKAIAPALEELAGEFEDRIDIFKLNIDENSDTTTQYRVKGIPTLLLFKGGKVVDQITGGVPKDTIKAMLEKAL